MESQIAKIQLTNTKTSNNYVFVMAEKASASDAELYMVAELPLLNPAALKSCEQICLAISAGLKRAYKRALNENSFESAVAQINEELGKLAEMGQTQWINKLNCILAVKNENTFTIATCGKISAYMLRSGEFTDISTSAAQSHPLKTFDSLASGKIRLGDVLILSNTQLLNFISIDRLKTILNKQSFLMAAQTIIELLKETAGPEVSFGTILNLQVTPGSVTEENVDLENYLVKNSSSASILNKTGSLIKSIVGLEALRRKPNADLPETVPLERKPEPEKKIPGTDLSPLELGKKLSPKEQLNLLKTSATDLWHSAKNNFSNFSGKVGGIKSALSPKQISNFSPAKKYLLIAVVILVIAAGLNIGLAIYKKDVVEKKNIATNKLEGTKKSLNLAQSALLYKDDLQAREYFIEAQNKLPSESEIYEEQKAEYQNILLQIKELKKQIEHTIEVEPTNLGNLGDAQNLITLTDYLAVSAGQNIISFEKATGKIEDGKLKSDDLIKDSYGFKTGRAVIYNGEWLKIWNYENNTLGPAIISSVPPEERFVGLSYYPVNNRAYLIDKQKNQIISFLINNDRLQNPVIAVTGNDLGNAIDITIDGNIFVLHPGQITKYSAGKLSDFQMPFLFEPFAGQGKLYTQINWMYLYLLDTEKNRVLVMDKKGSIVKMLTSSQFTNLRDFAVDEATLTIYLLNGSSILKVNY